MYGCMSGVGVVGGGGGGGGVVCTYHNIAGIYASTCRIRAYAFIMIKFFSPKLS